MGLDFDDDYEVVEVEGTEEVEEAEEAKDEVERIEIADAGRRLGRLPGCGRFP